MTKLEIEALGEAIQSRTERLVNRARLLEIATTLTEVWNEEIPALSNRPVTNRALNHLKTRHDTLLSHFARYIDRLHLSATAGRVFTTTKICVIAARDFLDVLRVIRSRKGNKASLTGALKSSSDQLWDQCATLAIVAKEVSAAHCGGGDTQEDHLTDGEIRRLLALATACVRKAGECVALGHCHLGDTGDFELSES